MSVDARIREGLLMTNTKLPAPDTIQALDAVTADAATRRRRRRRAWVAGAVAAAAVAASVVVATNVKDEPRSLSPTDSTPAPSDVEQLQAALAADPYGLAARGFSDGAAPTFHDLAGLWMLRTPYDGSLVVDGDGDWGYGLIHNQNAFGSSTLNGRTWTRNLNPGHCDDVTKLPWTSSIAGDGSLHLAFTGQLAACTPANDREVWDRLVPGPSPVMDFLRETSDQIDWQTPTDWSWPGLYVDPATGHVLEIAEDGSYQYLKTLTGNAFTPTSQGVLDPEGATQPGTLSGSCGDGNFTLIYQVGQIPEVAGYLTAHDAVKITPVGETCSPGIAAARTWVKVS